jgi:hypothetical protein
MGDILLLEEAPELLDRVHNHVAMVARPADRLGNGPVVRRERLGGVLSFYYRCAA